MNNRWLKMTAETRPDSSLLPNFLRLNTPKIDSRLATRGWLRILSSSIFVLAGCANSIFAYAQSSISLPGRGSCINTRYQSTDPLPTPPRWSPPSGGATQPTPPSSADQIIAGYAAPVWADGIYPDRASVCSGAQTKQASLGYTGSITPSGDRCFVTADPQHGYTEQYFDSSPIYRCPDGYVSGWGTSCVLSDARSVKKPADGTCNLIVQGNTYAIDNGGGVNAGDSDCDGACKVVINNKTEKNAGNACPAIGNPINVATGNKYQGDVIFQGQGLFPLRLVLQHNQVVSSSGAWGNRRRSNFERSLTRTVTNGFTYVNAVRPDGKAYLFVSMNGGWQPDEDISDKLSELKNSSGSTTGWKYTNGADEVESYSAAGKLLSIATRTGAIQTLVYSDGTTGPNGGYVLDANATPTTAVLPAGLLIRVADTANRTLNFGYDDKKRVVKMTDPVGNTTRYAYDANNNLLTITYPDNKTKQYLYNESAYTAGINRPNFLTGIIDENGARYAAYYYDGSARVAKEEHAPTLGLGIDKFLLTYNSTSSVNTASTTVTDPLGAVRTYTFEIIFGVNKATGQSQPGGAGCGASSSAVTYDANGNVASRADFNGGKTTYTYDLSRNLETKRIEGEGTSSARAITTEWHPTYRLIARQAEPLKVTVNSYDDKGNLLSKSVQATTDTSGSQGFAAPTGGTPRIWRYSYNAYGQVLTATGPRTDVNDVTTYAYDSQGNLVTVTNPAGQFTTLSNYDANGRVGKITDPNGLATTLTYSPRGWLTSRSVGGEVTTYAYDGVGQLTKVTQPDGTSITYTYDDAHRMTSVADSAGNRIAYTLDAMGNRTKEEIKDPSGTLAQQTTRVYDALNRLQQITGGMQ